MDEQPEGDAARHAAEPDAAEPDARRAAEPDAAVPDAQLAAVPDAQLAAVPDARLAAAFRDATADAPAPGFDAADVVATSRRITRRRRAVVAGAALAVLAGVGVGAGAGLTGPGTPVGGSTVASAASAGGTSDGAARAAAPEAAVPLDAPGQGAENPAPAAGRASSGPVSMAGAPSPAGVPLGPGTGECANRQDPALRALVEQGLPEVVGAPEAATTQECRPGGERGVALEVRDGAASGVLSVTSLPPGEPVDPPGTAQAPDAVVRTAPTASGGTVVVSSRVQRAGDPSPFAGRLDAVVAYLAPRL